ncbi:MAG TPA: hypothetical protein VNA25_09180 [Phycisphaerae bacterium]|nr:hypothetical protein [Phycisphaerae bacterium]
MASAGQNFLLEDKGITGGVDDCAAGTSECPLPEFEPLLVRRSIAADFNFDLDVSSIDRSGDVGVSDNVSNRVGRSTADKGTSVGVELFDDCTLDVPLERSIA